MNSSNRAALAMPIVLAASLFAQSHDAGAVPAAGDFSLRTPIHSHAGGEAGETYGVWAAGSRYKASFHGGMRFVPFVARGADPVSLAWRTVSARAGTTELATE